MLLALATLGLIAHGHDVMNVSALLVPHLAAVLAAVLANFAAALGLLALVEPPLLFALPHLALVQPRLFGVDPMLLSDVVPVVAVVARREPEDGARDDVMLDVDELVPRMASPIPVVVAPNPVPTVIEEDLLVVILDHLDTWGDDDERRDFGEIHANVDELGSGRGGGEQGRGDEGEEQSFHGVLLRGLATQCRFDGRPPAIFTSARIAPRHATGLAAPRFGALPSAPSLARPRDDPWGG
jgi:hypothetical protein